MVPCMTTTELQALKAMTMISYYRCPTGWPPSGMPLTRWVCSAGRDRPRARVGFAYAPGAGGPRIRPERRSHSETGSCPPKLLPTISVILCGYDNINMVSDKMRGRGMGGFVRLKKKEAGRACKNYCTLTSGPNHSK